MEGAFDSFQSSGVGSVSYNAPAQISIFPPDNTFVTATRHSGRLPPHSSHPNFANLTVLVLQAVLEVVFVALPGFILARMGIFDANGQRFAAELNIRLFTPALIFYKLSNQLRREDLPGLALIPLIFIVQTIISWACARFVSWGFGFKKRAQNFVVAMAVFGNSNSLPISLVTSLAFTIKGLHWDKEPNDDDSRVATRGITYLVLFQQLGQIVRWTWGYKELLKPPDEYKEEDLEESELKVLLNSRMENGHSRQGESQPFLIDYSDNGSISSSTESLRSTLAKVNSHASPSDFGSGFATPTNKNKYATSASTCSCVSGDCEDISHRRVDVFPTPTNGNVLSDGPSRNRGGFKPSTRNEPSSDSIKGRWMQFKLEFNRHCKAWAETVASSARFSFHNLPEWLQTALRSTAKALWNLMSAPLVAMILAMPLVLSPQIKHFFYGIPFIQHSVIAAVKQTGDVAVPLIIVVLGANLARNTLPAEQRNSSDPKFDRKVLIASLVARMLLPLVVMAPLLALTARYLPVNILGDPIFIIVCYLLAGAPSALQLAQICQINDVYMGAMTKLLFQSYVVWILPSTLLLVMCALETLEWAQEAKVD